MRNRQRLLILASLAVSAALLAVILRDVPVADVLESMRGADAGYLLATFFIAAPLTVFTRGIRWWVLLSRRLPLSQAAHMVNIMFLGNQLPMRLGEVARGVLAARAGLPLVTSATSIVVERLIDTLVVVLLLALSLSQLPDAPPEVNDTASAAGIAALAGFLLLLLLASAPQTAQRILERLQSALPQLKRLRLQAALGYLLDGLRPLRDWRAFAGAMLWTALAWAASVLHFYLLLLALGIEIGSPVAITLGVSMAALSLALPVTIAGVGAFQAAVVVAGSLVGISTLESLSLGFLLHGVTVLGYVVWGTVGMVALGVSPSFAFAREPEA